MEELYVVIGTDGVDSWVCSDVSDKELMSEGFRQNMWQNVLVVIVGMLSPDTLSK